MVDANRCPNCGSELPPGTDAQDCSRCRTLDDMAATPASDPLGPTRNRPGAIDPGSRVAPTRADAEATGDFTSETGAAPADAGDRAGGAEGQTRTAHGNGSAGGLPPGTTIRYFGDYEIRRELGRGGMGVVYEARQVSLNRPVALKLVKAGLLAGDDELRRFQNEAEAVALLDHPGIVPVYEAGEHQGQHYLSMKLVEGGSLVPLLGRYGGDPRAAARLAAEAAEAVAHAHARGILHRDLKPANILVDAEGHAHVTDFGLAKRVEEDVEFTQSGAILGTPAYMSPEQATGRRGSVTTATDVYGLGAVLYALLTGRAPFGGDSVVETLDAVRNAPPEPPTKLNVRVPRDLETICLKCLEKDPRRRYPTAQALADDLHRWLDNRPITARPVGTTERAWLWCKRRPAVAALAAAVVLALVGGTAATIAVQARANRVLGAKNVELTAALGREAKANADLTAANARVQQRYELAMDAIKTFHTGVSEDFLLKEPQFKDLRDRLLKSASDFYERLGALLDRETDLASRRALWQANFEMAVLAEKVGRKEDALALHRRVLAGRGALASSSGADPSTAADVARSHLAVGYVLYATGRLNEAAAAFERARAGASAGHGGPPVDAAVRADFAVAESWLGLTLGQLGRPVEGLRALERARDLLQALADANPADTTIRKQLAGTLNAIGMSVGEPDRSLPAFEAALAIWRELADADPDAIDSQRALGIAFGNVGVNLCGVGRLEEALAAHRQALAFQQRVAEANPAVAVSQAELAASHRNIGVVLRQMGRSAEALQSLEAALAIQRHLLEKDPDVAAVRRDVGISHLEIGIVLKEAGRLAEAEAELRAALALFQTLADADPRTPSYRTDLARANMCLADVLLAAGKPAEALAEFEATGPILLRLVGEHPGDPTWEDTLSSAWLSMSPLYLALGRYEAYRRHCRRMLDRFGDSSDSSSLDRTAKAGLLVPPPSPEEAARLRAMVARALDLAGPDHPYLRSYLLTLGLAEFRAGDSAAALEALARCMDGHHYAEILAPAHAIRAMALHRLGRAEEAEASLAEVRRLFDESSPPLTESSGPDARIAHHLAREAEAVVRLDPRFPADPFASGR